MEPAVSITDFHVALGDNPVLRGVDLVVDVGEIVAITGVNGSGKSTLLRGVAGLLPPTEGKAKVFGVPPSADPPFWRKVATTTEELAWYPALTVREHLELVSLVHGETPDGWPTVDDLLDDLGFADRADALPITLSSGQRQKLSLAAVLARPSQLLLLDEPEQRLDVEVRRQLAAMLGHYADRGGTVLMASHDEMFLDVVEARCRRLVDGVLADEPASRTR